MDQGNKDRREKGKGNGKVLGHILNLFQDEDNWNPENENSSFFVYPSIILSCCQCQAALNVM